ncbi:hypothetical protein [Natrinema sp. DC36]|uniref:hypothetical protein n=1 Tax=Natrinema sp. DC36 TaxID=2878680 RepID=UPI001CF0A5C3|nr:hypothetical protein [Natrinema sp. DC36]
MSAQQTSLGDFSVSQNTTDESRNPTNNSSTDASTEHRLVTDGGEVDLEFNTGDFRYIRIASDTKHPIDKWGGYSQDFDEAEHVYTHEEVQESSHDRWGIAGMDSTENVNGDFHLLIFDLDLYKTDEFDADDVQVTNAEGVPMVKSQNGGAHLYFALHDPVLESDINLNHDWIDLRGSAVKSHVVAPADIPGCEDSTYEVTNDTTVPVFLSVGEVLDRVEIDGEPIAEHDPTNPVDVDFDRGEAPDEMPDCYHAALSFRSSEAREEHPNAFKIDTYAGLLGLAAGYDVDTVTEDFGEYAPFGDSTEYDEHKTRKHLTRLVEKMENEGMCPPALSTLREHGILDVDEACSCSIDYHGSTPGDSFSSDDSGFHVETDLELHFGSYGEWIETTDPDTGATDVWFKKITNFTIDPKSFLYQDGERHIELEVNPSTGEKSYEEIVPATVFNDSRKFQNHVVTGISTDYTGGNKYIGELRKLIASQDVPIRTGVDTMGRHGDEFVVPDGCLTADGWTDDPDNVYLEQGNSIERAWEPSPGDDYDAQEIVDILELVTSMRVSERFLPVLSWFYTAPLKPLVMDWEGEFNGVSITGETGSGKTHALKDVLWPMAGLPESPKKCDSTQFTLLSALATTNAMPVWFDEYKPTDMEDWQLNNLHNFYRLSSSGGADEKGNSDMATDDYELQAPVVFTGEQVIQGPAEQRRTIMTRFLKEPVQDGSPMKQAYCELAGIDYQDTNDEWVYPDGYDLVQHSVAYNQFVLGCDDDELRSLWRESQEYVGEIFNKYGIDGVANLSRQGVQTVHFGQMLFRRFAEQMAEEAGVDSVDVPSEDDIEEAVVYIAEQFGAEQERKSHLDQFHELMSRVAMVGELERDTHFTVINEGKTNEALAYHVGQTLDEISEYVHRHGAGGADLFDNPSDYKDRLAEAADDDDSYVITDSQNSTPLNRCARIDPDATAEQLDFNLRAFGLGDEEDSPAENPESLEAVATAVHDLSNEGNPYVTVTVRVNNWDTDSEHGPEAQGVISDSTGTIDIVDWVGCDLDGKAPLEEDERYVLEDVRVSPYNGSLQLEIVKGTTKVEKIQEGVGYTGHADAGNNVILTAVADGGDTPNSEDTDTTDEDSTESQGDDDESVEELAERAHRQISARFDEGDDVSVPSFAPKIDAHPKTMLLAMNELESDGVVENVGGNVFRYLGGDE